MKIFIFQVRGHVFSFSNYNFVVLWGFHVPLIYLSIYKEKKHGSQIYENIHISGKRLCFFFPNYKFVLLWGFHIPLIYLSIYK